MITSFEVLLNNPTVCAALKQAWRESQPGFSGGHEEGGFIVEDSVGSVRVIRWPTGISNSIIVPAHSGGRIEGVEIVASFHTHPNTGPDYLQEPSETDKRSVRDDLDLKSVRYAGELVISATLIYGITQSGVVVEVGRTEDFLGET